MGPMDGRNGTYYGISLTHSRGTNAGTYHGRSYFKCSKNHGTFVKLEKILKIVKKRDGIRVSMSESLKLPDRGKGIVKFVGKTQFAKGIWYGIELHKKGNSDGSINNIQYFKCNHSCGIFIHEEKLFATLRGNTSVFLFAF